MQKEAVSPSRREEKVNASSTAGIVLHAPVLYDLTVWLSMRGKERHFRESVVKLARLAPGESVLDVGCGTGSLAVAAKRQVGPTGTVYGIDASAEMIARANKKARKAGAEVVFKEALAQEIPFPDGHFDVALSTVMLHHLPSKARLQCVREMQRVVKPGGRVLVVDFEDSKAEGGLFSRFHRRHGHVSVRDLVSLLKEAGFMVSDSGAVGIRNLQFVLATNPCRV
jgi:ubiquinone/menaquinone biosynthesis C-methylase UbiE